MNDFQKEFDELCDKWLMRLTFTLMGTAFIAALIWELLE